MLGGGGRGVGSGGGGGRRARLVIAICIGLALLYALFILLWSPSTGTLSSLGTDASLSSSLDWQARRLRLQGALLEGAGRLDKEEVKKLISDAAAAAARDVLQTAVASNNNNNHIDDEGNSVSGQQNNPSSPLANALKTHLSDRQALKVSGSLPSALRSYVSSCRLPSSRTRKDDAPGELATRGLDALDHCGARKPIPIARDLRPRVVVSMTTTPDRVEYMCPTVMSILQQSLLPDAIYIFLPRVSSRTGRAYPDPPWLRALPSPARVLLDSAQDDRGPATKLLPALEMETDPETIIITVDDDYYYHEHLVATLVAYSIWNSKQVYAFSSLGIDSAGWVHWRPDKVEAEVLEAYVGVAYRRGMFDDQTIFRNPKDISPACFFTDDIIISTHLQANGYKRILLKDCLERLEYGNDARKPLRAGNFGAESHNHQCALALMEKGVLKLTD
eukprot:jgi/Chlat1/1023/Chrsp109S01452